VASYFFRRVFPDPSDLIQVSHYRLVYPPRPPDRLKSPMLLLRSAVFMRLVSPAEVHIFEAVIAGPLSCRSFPGPDLSVASFICFDVVSSDALNFCPLFPPRPTSFLSKKPLLRGFCFRLTSYELPSRVGAPPPAASPAPRISGFFGAAVTAGVEGIPPTLMFQRNPPPPSVCRNLRAYNRPFSPITV